MAAGFMTDPPPVIEVRPCGSAVHYDDNPPEVGPPDGHLWTEDGQGGHSEVHLWCPRTAWARIEQVVPGDGRVVVARPRASTVPESASFNELDTRVRHTDTGSWEPGDRDW
jgi:hypothetical protein